MDELPFDSVTLARLLYEQGHPEVAQRMLARLVAAGGGEERSLYRAITGEEPPADAALGGDSLRQALAVQRKRKGHAVPG